MNNITSQIMNTSYKKQQNSSNKSDYLEEISNTDNKIKKHYESLIADRNQASEELLKMSQGKFFNHKNQQDDYDQNQNQNLNDVSQNTEELLKSSSDEEENDVEKNGSSVGSSFISEISPKKNRLILDFENNNNNSKISSNNRILNTSNSFSSSNKEMLYICKKQLNFGKFYITKKKSDYIEILSKYKENVQVKVSIENKGFPGVVRNKENFVIEKQMLTLEAYSTLKFYFTVGSDDIYANLIGKHKTQVKFQVFFGENQQEQEYFCDLECEIIQPVLDIQPYEGVVLKKNEFLEFQFEKNLEGQYKIEVKNEGKMGVDLEYNVVDLSIDLENQDFSLSQQPSLQCKNLNQKIESNQKQEICLEMFGESNQNNCYYCLLIKIADTEILYPIKISIQQQ